LYQHVAETTALMGEDYWPYGVAPNEAALRTFLGYLHDQGLTERPHPVAELFPAGAEEWE
jgi:4,5-dihydroxyphthalate decarboxylase